MLTVSAAMTPLVTEGNGMTKLTKSKIDGLEIKSKDYFLWDSELPGFGIRIFPSGRKKFVLQYRHGRKSRRMALGQHGAITLDQARKLAIQALGKIGRDIDPLQERKDSRQALTVKELADRFDAEHIAVHLKQTTAKEYRREIIKVLIILPLGARSALAGPEHCRSPIIAAPQRLDTSQKNEVSESKNNG